MIARRRAFTLIELLVVITIILLISAVTIPLVLPAINHRAISEAARIVQAQLVQARDTAIRFNSPRGVRFLPDPTYDFASTGILAYNRMVPIEPAPQYSNGMVTIWPVAFATNGDAQPWTNPATPYPSNGTTIGGGGSGLYPAGPPGPNNTANTTGGQVLVVEQSLFQNNDVTQFINAPTSWYWNIRVGDKIQINGQGATYTIVGPCTINPFSNSGANPEMFVNVGTPGDTSKYLMRAYTDSSGTAGNPLPVEFLYLVNGIDDDKDGYVDNGWDGIDNNTGYVYNRVIDDLGKPSAAGSAAVPSEWEMEAWQGTLARFTSPIAPQTSGAFATPTSATNAAGFSLLAPSSYIITRRPVPSQSARETMLPRDVVIDATTGFQGQTNERSRIPGLDPFSHYADILLLPSGQVVPTTLYSSPASFSLTSAFYHLWLAERGDVHAPSEIWGGTPAAPTANPNSGMAFYLPLPQDAYTGHSFTTPPQVALKGERMLLTLFGRTGQITTSSVEFFDCKDVGMPFYDSQLGAREAK